MERDTRFHETDKQSEKAARRATHRRLWWMELTRGLLAVALGLLFLLAARPFAPRLLTYGLGTYLLVDALLELYGLRNRKIASQRVSILDAAGGAASLLIGLLCLLFPNTTALVLSSLLALRIIIEGTSQLRTARHSPGTTFQWLSGGLYVLIGLFLLLFPVVVMTVLVFFLGCYLLIAGTALLLKGLSLRFALEGRGRSPSRSYCATPNLDSSLPSLTHVAIVFVRRSGADGLGHIGWGFAGHGGRFYVGSVENAERKPFTRPEDMGFWCMRTLDPLATMQYCEYPYDEYKLFFVPQPRPSEAWKTVIGERQEPYSFVHHNCCDVAYAILRSYGCEELLDPAAEYVPNDWYDALPGQSYPIEKAPCNSQYRQSRRHLVRREVALVIPAHLKGLSPSWRLQLWRPWEELLLVWEMMLGHVRARCLLGIKLITERLHRSTPHP